MKKDISLEMRAWRAYRQTAEILSSRIAGDINRATGLSAGDFAILMTLELSSEGHLRQREMLDLLEWDKSRLSHQLTRMAGRGLVQRVSKDTTVSICITNEGRKQLAVAKPVHEESLQVHFAAHLSMEEYDTLIAIAEKLLKR